MEPSSWAIDWNPAYEDDHRLQRSVVTALAEEGVLDAHAPRAEGASDAEAVELAADNATRARRILDGAPPDPRAVFVNDATIPLQGEGTDAALLTDYCDRADAAVLNAFESDELGTDDPVSRRERAALETLRAWADRVIRLDGGE
jgi:hypothetical protein